MNKFNISVLLLVVVLITSCKDDEKPSRKAILTSKTWTFTKIELKVNGATTDFTNFFFEDCDKDDTFTLAESGTYTSSVGADDCDGDAENSTGTWSLSSDEKTLTIVDDGDTEVWTINSIDSGKIVIESPETSEDFDGDGDNETGSVIFTATAK
jgi:hypothetical protein